MHLLCTYLFFTLYLYLLVVTSANNIWNYIYNYTVDPTLNLNLSGMCSGWIVNSGVVYNAYQFEPDWNPEDISEEDRAEPVQARLLMICLVVVVSYF